MASIIEEYSMTAKVGGSVIAATISAGSHEWIVAPWLRYYIHNEVITVFTLAARLAAGHRDSGPFAAAWCGELR
jgi:hypothetical protein